MRETVSMVTDLDFCVKQCEMKITGCMTALAMALTVFQSPAIAEEGLDNWFSQDEIQRLGLDRLSRPQQELLSGWIAARIADIETETRQSMEQGAGYASDTTATLDVFKTRIKGELHGWNGNTVFAFENGQVWQQRGDERSTVSVINPSVVVKKNFLGFYVMELEATGAKIRVKRVR